MPQLRPNAQTTLALVDVDDRTTTELPAGVDLLVLVFMLHQHGRVVEDYTATSVERLVCAIREKQGAVPVVLVGNFGGRTWWERLWAGPTIRRLEQRVGLPVVGIIPDDRNLRRGAVPAHTPALRAAGRLAKRLVRLCPQAGEVRT